MDRTPIGRPRHDRDELDTGKLAGGCAAILVMWAIGIGLTIALVWLAIKFAVPWVIDVVMDAIESRGENS